MAAGKLQAMLKKTQALYAAEKKATSELKAKAGITDEVSREIQNDNFLFIISFW